MAKTGWQSLVINDENAWKNAGKVKTDPVTDRRAKAVASIDSALAIIESKGEPTRMSLFKIKADVARAGLRLGRRTVQLNGQDAVFVPAERLADFYGSLKDAVEAGELDAELAAAAGEDAPVAKRRGRKAKVG